MFSGSNCLLVVRLAEFEPIIICRWERKSFPHAPKNENKGRKKIKCVRRDVAIEDDERQLCYMGPLLYLEYLCGHDMTRV